MSSQHQVILVFIQAPPFSLVTALPLFLKLDHISDSISRVGFIKCVFVFWHFCMCPSACHLITSSLLDYTLPLSRIFCFFFIALLTLKYTVQKTDFVWWWMAEGWEVKKESRTWCFLCNRKLLKKYLSVNTVHTFATKIEVSNDSRGTSKKPYFYAALCFILICS
jgi:hypothetical protein